MVAKMSAKDENEEKKEVKNEGAPKKKKKLLIIGLLVTVPLILGFVVAGVLLLLPGENIFSNLFQDPVADDMSKYLAPMEEFQINLADPGGRRFLRTHFTFGYNEGRLTEELVRREHEIRSDLIALLRAKTVEDLQEPGGMDQLEEDIKATLNEILISGEVKQVYFGDFIIQ